MWPTCHKVSSIFVGNIDLSSHFVIGQEKQLSASLTMNSPVENNQYIPVSTVRSAWSKASWVNTCKCSETPPPKCFYYFFTVKKHEPNNWSADLLKFEINFEGSEVRTIPPHAPEVSLLSRFSLTTLWNSPATSGVAKIHWNYKTRTWGFSVSGHIFLLPPYGQFYRSKWSRPGKI